MRTKKQIFTLALLLITAITFAQKTETRTFGDLSKLQIIGKTYVAELIPSTENKMEITSSDLTMDKIISAESNGELKITVKGFASGNVSIKIYCKTIPPSIEISNGALLKSTEKIKVGQILLVTNSDGYIHLILESENVTAQCNSGGDMTLEGTTQTFTASANTNATCRVEMMTMDNATVKAFIGAEIHLSAKNNISCTTGTNGKIHIYKPYATNITETNESGGTVIRE